MSLRGAPVVDEALLPDGRRVTVRIGLADDSYVAARELDTVSLDLTSDGEVLATVNTILEPHQESDALRLVREIVARLAAGDVEPTAHAMEQFADSLPE